MAACAKPIARGPGPQRPKRGQAPTPPGTPPATAPAARGCRSAVGAHPRCPPGMAGRPAGWLRRQGRSQTTRWHSPRSSRTLLPRLRAGRLIAGSSANSSGSRSPDLVGGRLAGIDHVGVRPTHDGATDNLLARPLTFSRRSTGSMTVDPSQVLLLLVCGPRFHSLRECTTCVERSRGKDATPSLTRCRSMAWKLWVRIYFCAFRLSSRNR
jgi:hypothetical protein